MYRWAGVHNRDASTAYSRPVPRRQQPRKRPNTAAASRRTLSRVSSTASLDSNNSDTSNTRARRNNRPATAGSQTKVNPRHTGYMGNVFKELDMVRTQRRKAQDVDLDQSAEVAKLEVDLKKMQERLADMKRQKQGLDAHKEKIEHMRMEKQRREEEEMERRQRIAQARAERRRQVEENIRKAREDVKRRNLKAASSYKNRVKKELNYRYNQNAMQKKKLHETIAHRREYRHKKKQNEKHADKTQTRLSVSKMEQRIAFEEKETERLHKHITEMQRRKRELIREQERLLEEEADYKEALDQSRAQLDSLIKDAPTNLMITYPTDENDL